MKAPKPGTKLKGSLDPGYRDMLATKSVEKPPAEILADPSIVAALDVVNAIGELPDEEVDEGITLVANAEASDPYSDTDEEDIGNGSTTPLRYRDRPTLGYTTCSEPVKDVNRGCPGYYRCPLRDLGSGNLVFQDNVTKQIRSDNCLNALLTGIIGNRRYVLLPGVNFSVSQEVRWAPWPDGTPVKAGPNEPKTHLEKIPVKNPVPAVFAADLIRQYEILRRRGDVR